MKHLFRKIVPDRVSWDEQRIVTIDGNVIKDSNIADLINDAMRERKTVKAVGRISFTIIPLNISSALVKNKRLLSIHDVAVNNVKLRLRASFTPFILKAWVLRRLYREYKEGEKRKNYEQKIDEENSLILSHEKLIPPYLCKREKIGYSIGKNWDNDDIWKTILRSVAWAIRQWII